MLIVVKKKSAIVKKDEKELNDRMLLNLGHTFAHAIEKELQYKIKHGNAVSVGLLMAVKLSVLLKKTSYKNFDLIKSHLLKLDLPVSLKCLSSKKKWNTKSLIKSMKNDKKKVDENLKFILLNDIGKAYIENSVAYEKIKLTIKDFCNNGNYIILSNLYNIFFNFFICFFSSSETAITSISEDVLQKKVEENDYNSIKTQRLLKKKSSLLVVFY